MELFKQSLHQYCLLINLMFSMYLSIIQELHQSMQLQDFHIVFSIWVLVLQSPLEFYLGQEKLFQPFYNIQNMSVVQTIENAKQKIQTGNIADLRQGLKQIASLTKDELKANQSSINQPIQQVTEAIQRNIKINQQQINQNAGLKTLFRQVQNVLPPKLKKQVNATFRSVQDEITKKIQQNAIQKAIKNETKKIQQQIVKAAVQQKDVQNMSILPVQKPISQINQTPIQQSIQEFKPLLNNQNLPKITKPSQIPQTMKLLSRYAQLRGANSIGSVSNQLGISYVGTRTIDRGNGVMQIIPFQKNPIQKTNIPSLPMQLQYYANRTINSWNKYVDNQAQFINFISKINTQSDRKAFVQKQCRNLNTQTFTGQVICTIVHYYVYLPLQRMAARININSNIQPTLEGFLNSYQLGSSPQSNPLMLTTGNGRVIAKSLFSAAPDLPSNIYNGLIDIVRTMMNGLNQQNIVKLQTYKENRIFQARNFLKQNGVQSSLIKKIIIGKDWSSLKKKKFLVSQGMVNSQIHQIITRIVNQQQEKSSVRLMSFRWGSAQIWSHDYIWGWNTRD